MEKTCKLGLKDKKLLFEIDFDARQSYSNLAKKLKMSKRGVEYKLRNLETKRVVIGYAPLINITKLGYLYCRVFVKFHNFTKKIEREVEEFIKHEKGIGWSIRYYGIFDNGFTVWARNITEFKSIANRFYLKFDKYIKRRAESIGTEVIFYKNRYLLKNDDVSKICIKEIEDAEELDEIDKKIIILLSDSPRSNLVEIADKLGESAKLISYRMKRLINNRILLGTRPIINHEILGYTYYKIFFYLNNLDETKIHSLENYIESNSRTLYIIKAIGTCDLDIEIMVESNQDLLDFFDEIQNRFPDLIKDYETMMLTKTIKSTYHSF